MTVATSKKNLVILAEDSSPNRKILVHLLQKLNLEVVACANGEEAWKAIQDPQNHGLVAVLSDVMMPGMDGLSLLRHIREYEPHKDIPVLFITALSDKDLIVKARSWNVNGYLLKPITFQKVQEAMGSLLPGLSFSVSAKMNPSSRVS